MTQTAADSRKRGISPWERVSRASSVFIGVHPWFPGMIMRLAGPIGIDMPPEQDRVKPQEDHIHHQHRSA